MGLWTMRIGVTALVTAVTGMAASAATAAPAVDSVTGEALLPGPLLVQADATSGPSGRSPSGQIAIVGPCCTRNPNIGGTVTCLRVSANRAIAGLSRPGVDPFSGRPVNITRLVEIVDGGSPGVGVDVVTMMPITFDAPPITVCPATLPPGGERLVVREPLGPGETGNPFFPDRPLGQDLVVADAGPVPTFRDECKRGGYARLGFANQGRCIASVGRGPDPAG